MIAKVICRGENRKEAIVRLDQALSDIKVINNFTIMI